MKILFANCGYLTGLSGRLDEYFFLIWRYVFEDTGASQELIDTLKKENPDVCLFVEMKEKSIQKLAEELPVYEHIVLVEKYGKGFLSRVGKRNVHAILSKYPIENSRKILFSAGSKRSVLETVIGGVTFYVCHLSLQRKIRHMQIRELRSILLEKKSAVLAGDFNVFGGEAELLDFESMGVFRNLDDKKQNTFPAYHPQSELDYIFATSDIHQTEFTILPEVFSDHRALCCTIIK